MTQVMRTSEDRFADLPDFGWQPRYVEDLDGLRGLRVAYLDEGPADAAHTFLCLHGEPTWGFLYRKMIPPFLATGARVVVPDFLGFGRSDKPIDDAFYTFHRHRDTLLALIRRLDLHAVTLVVQDWGGLLGLTLPVDANMRGRITRLIVMDTAIAVGESLGEGFDNWRMFSSMTEDMPAGQLLSQSEPYLTAAEAAAYDAPFEDARFKAGVRMFPKLVMTEPGMGGVETSRQAAKFWRDDWQGPTFMACGATDPVFPPDHMRALAAQINGCPPPLVIPDAGHFVQERGDIVAAAALEHFNGQIHG